MDQKFVGTLSEMPECSDTSETALHKAYSTICSFIAARQGMDCSMIEDMQNTPARCVKALQESIVDYKEIALKLRHNLSCLSTLGDRALDTSVSDYDSLLVQGPISAKSICPHHLLPVFYEVWVGVLHKNTKVLGLSKIARIVQLLSRRAVVQEELAVDVANIFHKGINLYGETINGYEASGSMALMHASHSCMLCRGVEEHALTSSFVVRGLPDYSPHIDSFHQIVNSSRMCKTV